MVVKTIRPANVRYGSGAAAVGRLLSRLFSWIQRPRERGLTPRDMHWLSVHLRKDVGFSSFKPWELDRLNRCLRLNDHVKRDIGLID